MEITIKPFSAGVPPLIPLGKLKTFSRTPEFNEEGILPPHSPPLSHRDPTGPRSASELVPPLFRPKLRPRC